MKKSEKIYDIIEKYYDAFEKFIEKKKKEIYNVRFRHRHN